MAASPSFESPSTPESASLYSPSLFHQTMAYRRGKITYSVNFNNNAGEELFSSGWNGLLDISQARKGVARDDEEGAVLHVTTVLDTSVPQTRDDQLRSSTYYSSADQILDNPDVLVSIRQIRITIQSKALIRAIGMVVGSYPAVDPGAEIIDLDEPFPLLGHNMRDLEDFQATCNPSTDNLEVPACQFRRRATNIEQKHLGLLLNFVKDNIYKDDIEAEEQRHSRNSCTHRMLWLLFRPGETVYVRTDGKFSAFVVTSVEVNKGSWNSNHQGNYRPLLLVNVWNLQFDGKFVGRSARSVSIPHFNGELPVTSLQVFPSRFLDDLDGGETRAKLVAKGKRWYDLLRGGQAQYSGELGGLSGRRYEGRVYVDSEEYHSQQPAARLAPQLNFSDRGWSESIPNVPEWRDRVHRGQSMPPGGIGGNPGAGLCSCEECHGRRPHPSDDNIFSRYDLLDPKRQKDLTLECSTVYGPDHRYLVCDSKLHGFILKSRTWEELDVAYCLKPKINTQAIDTLVMPPERKSMIKALIQKFAGPQAAVVKPWGADFIESKGEGQIILLHGSPGVGKTYTAECIAEYTHRPLLSLTCGDIGTEETRVETELSKWFRLAERWGAVMLLDEADTYLETRLTSDIKRNALVSVFLRCIEYYRGILFLTTNRVGQFDDAFISRIHVIIKYDRLSNEDCKTIWRQFFNKLSDERKDFEVARRAQKYVLDDEIISSMKWNGREIRNAFQTAVALAEYRFSEKPNKTDADVPTLDQRDFEDVFNMTVRFKNYLTDVHGHDEENRAFLAKTRAGYNER